MKLGHCGNANNDCRALSGSRVPANARTSSPEGAAEEEGGGVPTRAGDPDEPDAEFLGAAAAPLPGAFLAVSGRAAPPPPHLQLCK
jgi:hypothetical protein